MAYKEIKKMWEKNLDVQEIIRHRKLNMMTISF